MEKGQTTILLVDDEESNIKLLEAILTIEGYAVRSASCGEDALDSVAEQAPDLILLDIMMPGIDGFEVVRRLKEDLNTTRIPVILLTALNDSDSRIKGLSAGASEFLSKPVERAELLIRVGNLIKVKEYQDYLLNHNAILDKRIQWLAHYDILTGLPNRALLGDRANLAISMAHRHQTTLAILFLDLDHFKNINDTLSHHIGDEVLIKIAKALQSVVREQDTVSRQGGDEFILVLPDTDAEGASFLAQKLLEVVAQHVQVEQYELVLTASIGIAIYPHDGDDFMTLSQNADIAMYRAKLDGRNCFRFFTREMQICSTRILQLENALQRALELNQMYLHYQPKISLQNGNIIGAEALLRWKHPDLGFVSPAEFIPVAENSGQILKIGEWVLREAVQQLKKWIDRGMKPLVISVNLSVVQFRHPQLHELVTQILDEADLPPEYLELELTESVAMDNPIEAIEVMNKLHKHNINLSIDDFGTGFSSLSYLKRFHVCKLKIDQSFVADITKDQEYKAIVAAIISMAQSLNMHTIAEGVETIEQLTYLQNKGCEEVQGYFFSEPLPADKFEYFVRQKKGCQVP